ncbi:averufin oxidase A homolog [Aspergillus lentulus]|uniref:Averufin oxidase A homolog n=1 Tax=Aspergillus lentulus TaxID=293939 RepID=A0ABQ1B6H9_ASPLE|nr:averufin oxidase A homolog [Aspergillus lentulus]GFF56821.1 averufin oxidase A homolog [Aspergillus lentulus]GFF81163.1 averufin oxidase A homolog [Aspergillus lentulus]GFF94681.1 averufin oxidase A homolog [Aspergillus lentulus]GFG18484.1 averufin oxidase A homolog [Aspergillus lentulus]
MAESNLKPGPGRLALLGATGNTGRMVLRKLLENSDISAQGINIYVRSRAKLEMLFPSLSNDPRVKVFEGSIKDQPMIQDCLAAVSTIICTLGENENIPGVTVLSDFARATINALSTLQSKGESSIKPHLIMLSSATMNPQFAADRPALLHWMIRNAFAKPYNDLIKAEEMLLAVPELLSVTLIQPNALVEERSTGCVVSADFAYMACSYEDLAEGFVRVCTSASLENQPRIGVSSARAKNPMLYAPFVLGKVFRGLAFQFIPGYWQAEYRITARLRSRPTRSKRD